MRANPAELARRLAAALAKIEALQHRLARAEERERAMANTVRCDADTIAGLHAELDHLRRQLADRD